MISYMVDVSVYRPKKRLDWRNPIYPNFLGKYKYLGSGKESQIIKRNILGFFQEKKRKRSPKRVAYGPFINSVVKGHGTFCLPPLPSKLFEACLAHPPPPVHKLSLVRCLESVTIALLSV